MVHQQLIRIVPGAKTAVLFMHGIAGTPGHFRQGVLPLEELVPKEFSVYNVLLDGHGREVEDFAHSSMAKWKNQVFDIFQMLCHSHERVILVGHSMGTLFAIRMALECPDKVPFLFLLNCPLLVGVKAFGAVNLIKLSYGLLNENDPIQAATARVTGIRQTRQSWRYIGWLPRVAELIGLMHETIDLIPQLRVKSVAFQSRHDELVSCRSCRILRQSGNVEVHGLCHSTHFYYTPEDVAFIQRRFLELMKNR